VAPSGVLEEEAANHLPVVLEAWGALQAPSWVRSEAPADEKFSNILEAPDGLSYNLILGTKRTEGFLPTPHDAV